MDWCQFFWNYYITLTLTVVAVILSVVISISSYTKIFLRLRQQRAQIQHNFNQAQQNEGKIPLNIARYKKTVSSIAWVQLALVVCYLPISLMIILRYRTRWINESSVTVWMVWVSAVALMYLNSTLNPILYCWKIREVRQAVKDTFRQFCCLSG